MQRVRCRPFFEHIRRDKLPRMCIRFILFRTCCHVMFDVSGFSSDLDAATRGARAHAEHLAVCP